MFAFKSLLIKGCLSGPLLLSLAVGARHQYMNDNMWSVNVTSPQVAKRVIRSGNHSSVYEVLCELMERPTPVPTLVLQSGVDVEAVKIIHSSRQPNATNKCVGHTCGHFSALCLPLAVRSPGYMCGCPGAQTWNGSACLGQPPTAGPAPTTHSAGNRQSSQYWAPIELSMPSLFNAIQRLLSYTGLDIKTSILVSRNLFEGSFSMDVFGDQLYWSDSQNKAVYVINKKGVLGVNELTLVNAVTDIEKIKVLDSRRQTNVTKRCSHSRCAHMCLPVQRDYRCDCPKNRFQFSDVCNDETTTTARPVMTSAGMTTTMAAITLEPIGATHAIHSRLFGALCKVLPIRVAGCVTTRDAQGDRVLVAGNYMNDTQWEAWTETATPGQKATVANCLVIADRTFYITYHMEPRGHDSDDEERVAQFLQAELIKALPGHWTSHVTVHSSRHRRHSPDIPMHLKPYELGFHLKKFEYSAICFYARAASDVTMHWKYNECTKKAGATS